MEARGGGGPALATPFADGPLTSERYEVAPERIRVLQLIKCLGFGGAERLVVSTAEARDRARFDYEVAYVLDTLDDLVEELQAHGITVHSLGSRSHFDLRWMRRLRALVLERRYDIVHLHLPYSAALGRLVARSLPAAHRPSVVYTQHNLWDRTDRTVRLLNRLTINLDDRDIAVSEVAKASMPKAVRDRVEVIVHGISMAGTDSESQTREDVRRSLGLAPDDVAIVTVANFRTEKGYPFLISAASDLVREGLPIRFLAVGAGPLETKVRRMCEQYRLGDRFQLLGFRGDVARILAAADLFVLASLHEAFPVSVMEALAAGLPVVATDVGAVAQALGNGLAGITVPPGDVTRLTDAIRTVVVDTDLRASLTAQARPLGAGYDIRTTVARLEEIYTALMSTGPPAAPAVP